MGLTAYPRGRDAGEDVEHPLRRVQRLQAAVGEEQRVVLARRLRRHRLEAERKDHDLARAQLVPGRVVIEETVALLAREAGRHHSDYASYRAPRRAFSWER